MQIQEFSFIFIGLIISGTLTPHLYLNEYGPPSDQYNLHLASRLERLFCSHNS